MHLVIASIATTLVITSWWVHWRTRKTESLVLLALRIPVELLSIAAIGLAVHLGGF